METKAVKLSWFKELTQSYKFFRKEYQRVSDIALFTMMGLCIVSGGLVFLSYFVDSMAIRYVLWIAYGFFSASTVVAFTIQMVDKHEKKLKE